MARLARICIPEIPLHIIQRGDNRQNCFVYRERNIQQGNRAADKSTDENNKESAKPKQQTAEEFLL